MHVAGCKVAVGDGKGDDNLSWLVTAQTSDVHPDAVQQ
jgi:hypothetical protein